MHNKIISKPFFSILFIFLFICLHAIHNFCFSQDKDLTDNLLKALNTEKEDTHKINLLNRLHDAYVFNSPGKALGYAEQSLLLAQKISDKKAIGDAQNRMGDALWVKGKDSTAAQYYNESLKINLAIENKPGLIANYRNLGKIYHSKSDFSSALEYFLKAAKIAEEINEKDEIAKCYNWIGINFREQGIFTKAWEYFQKAIEIENVTGNKTELGKSYLNIGHIMSNYGFFQSSKDTLKLSLDYYDKALELLANSQNYILISSCYNGMGIDNEELGNYQEALLNYEKALEYKTHLGDEDNMAATYTNIGNTYTKLGDYKKAIQIQKKCLEIAKRTGKKYNALFAYKALADIYEKMKDYKTLLTYYDSSIEIYKIIYTDKYAEMQTKYETEKKESEINSLTLKNQILGQKNEIQNLQIKNNRFLVAVLLSVVALIFAIAFLLIRQNRLRSQHNKIELEQKLLRSQMNPHFIFNAMMGVQNYIYKQDPDTAAKYLSSIVKLMRSILEGSRKEFVLLDKEISSLQQYLLLQQLRFNNTFDYTIEVNPAIDAEGTSIPPMIAQPVIENAIEHGIRNRPDGKGMIKVSFDIRDEILVLSIEDNGVGREKAKEISKGQSGTHLSVSSNITQERLANLNRKLKKKITMVFHDLKNEKNEATGTKVVFLFPLNIFCGYPFS